MGRLEGKAAVITGGASGIGEASARLFVREGARVLIADIQDERGRKLAAELGSSAVYQHTDITREEEVKAAVERAVREFGRLDCMFNNAGFGGAPGGIAEITLDGFQKTVDVLFKGVFLGMKHAAAVMIPQRSGVILSTASIAGLRAVDATHIYSACKAAVIHLTRSAAMELGEHGIRVNCICPGWIVTPLFGKEFGLSPEAAERSLGAIKEAFAGLQPIHRAGLPEDVAQAALWLASDESSFVTGHALVVDGGISNGRTWTQFMMDMVPLAKAMGL